MKKNTFDEKIQLYSKYNKTEKNSKLESEFFKLFFLLYSVNKPIYKLKLFKK